MPALRTNRSSPQRALMLAIAAALALGTNNYVSAQQFPASINLGDVNGSNGFRLDAAQPGINSVNTLGDINGDGIDDLIIGTDQASPNGQYQAGAIYVVFGKRTPFSANTALESVNGTNGFRLDGAMSRDRAGTSVSAAGDINGDGIVDLIIGACCRYDRPGGSYVVFGKNTPFPATLALSSLDGNTGFRLQGVADGDFTGLSVSYAGDVNGDGIDDLLVGAKYAASNGPMSGSTYVLFGKSAPFAATLALSSLNGSNGFRLDGTAVYDAAGLSVAAAGDVNGDSIDDLIIGSHGADIQTLPGSSYVVFGKSTPFAATFQLSSLNGANGFRLNGSASSSFGRSVSSAGDLNGDDIDDLIIGAPNTGANGASYIVFGKNTPFSNFFSLNGTNGFRLDGVVMNGRAGASVSSAGDVNGDGIGDVIIGAPGASFGSGRGYVVFGQRESFGSTISLFSLNGTNGFRLDEAVGTYNTAQSVSSAGDINGDGIGDVIVNARASSGSRSYVVFGRDTGAFKDGFE